MSMLDKRIFIDERPKVDTGTIQPLTGREVTSDRAMHAMPACNCDNAK